MNQSDDRPNEPCGMRHFTAQLLLGLNSTKNEEVDDAMEKWEKAIADYKIERARLESLMPAQSQPLLELHLHDWNLLKIDMGNDDPETRGGESAQIVLKYKHDLVVLSYELSGKVVRIAPPAEWFLSVAASTGRTTK